MKHLIAASFLLLAIGACFAQTPATLPPSQYAGTSGGTAQAQTVTISPAVTALKSGLRFSFKPGNANTGAAPTIAPNGLTATAVTKCGTTALIASDLTTAAIADVQYDGTEFQLLNPQAAGCPTVGLGTVTSVATGSGLTGGPITSSGTISIPSAGVTNSMLANNSVTVTAGSGLSGGGTVALGGTITLTNAASGGTVTSVATGSGLTGGPITTSGTISIPSAGVTNAMLANNSATVATGTGLLGGGAVALGATITLTPDPSVVCMPGAYSAQTDAATVTWAVGTVMCANASLLFTVHSGSRTLNVTGLVGGGTYILELKQDSTGGEGLILGTGCSWKVSNGGGGTITPSTGSNAIDVLTFSYNSTSGVCLVNFNTNFN